MKRFDIQQYYGQPLNLGNTIVPVTNVDNLLSTFVHKQTSATNTTRDDDYVCPANKKWTVVFVGGYRDAASTANARIIFTDDSVQMFIESWASATTWVPTISSKGLQLKPGDTLRISTGSAASGNITTQIGVIEESVD